KHKAAVALVAAWFLTERADHARALSWAESAVRWAPSSTAFRQRGLARKGLGQHTAAEQDILKSQELGSTTTAHDLATLRRAEGRRDDAEALYRADLYRDRQQGDEENIATVCCNLGRLLIQTNR